ncbi:hypothetical protein Cgig2_001112 [Carnegiea gigantea]|uniref:Uncharacterized protein n=1 Tax=Carnegiea gigantea TaxID=171969 RepID=A0A9Q1JX12_9CARY|nr:hypothetical protein Cgig2_001112 [Carnegiea gigantea]
MVRLPVCLGDKTESRSLKVDFLIVNVPTAYNVILGRPTLYKRSGAEKRRGGGYTSGSPPSSCSSPSEVPTSASRGLVALSPTTSPSVEGGMKSTSSGSRPSASARSRSSTKRSLSPHRWYRETSPSSRRHSATAFTPRANTSTMAISSSLTLGGSEALGVAKSQDLTISWTRKSLTTGSALMKLAEGRGASGEVPLAAGVAPPAGGGALAWPGYAPPMSGSPIGEGPTTQLSAPPPARGQKPRPQLAVPQSSASSELVGSQPASFRKIQERAPVVYRTFLASCVTTCCLSSSRLHSVSAATCSGVASPVSKTVSAPSLDLHKANRKIRRPATTRKKSLVKTFSLGSQFSGSLSLDLLLLFSGPFIDSVA